MFLEFCKIDIKKHSSSMTIVYILKKEIIHKIKKEKEKKKENHSFIVVVADGEQ